MGIVPLKYDFAFKSVMGNETVRRHFVSDVLGIPLGRIRSVRVANPFLWRRAFWQKQGILDILLLLDDGSKVNVELQVRILKHWDRRALFYLSKMFTEDLLIGQDYTKLKKCISISILDFSLDGGPRYHRTYRLRDTEGHEFSDMLEVHIIELKKELGGGPVDDWIRLINAETEEDLDMIRTKTKSLGILEAISEVREMGLVRNLRAVHEARLKMIRDQNARDAYVRDEGISIGEMCTLIDQARKKAARGIPAEEAADMLERDSALIRRIYEAFRAHPEWDDERISRELAQKEFP